MFIFSDEEVSLEGEIKAETGDELISLPIVLNFIEDYKPLDEEDEYDTAKTCSELGGIICSSDEECSIGVVDAKDDKCCLGSCEEIKKSSTGKIIGWVIIILIVVLLGWFFMKAKKKKK